MAKIKTIRVPRAPKPKPVKPVTAPATLASRQALLDVLAAMPDEAFSWLVLTIIGQPFATGRGQVWPDGTGGFSVGSQQSIAAAKLEARKLVGM